MKTIRYHINVINKQQVKQLSIEVMVRNITSPRSGREVANQFVINTNKGTFFQSYDTIIAKVDNKAQIWLSKDWCYSRTTMKYLYQFLSDYGWRELSSDKVRKLIKNKTFKYKEALTM